MREIFVSIVEFISMFTMLDKVLVIILIVSLLFKGVFEIICWFIQKSFNTDKKHEKKCVFLECNKPDNCKISKWNGKYFVDGICIREKCPSYRVTNFTIDEIKFLHKIPFLMLTITKWISELSSIILVIRTLVLSITPK